MALDSEKNLYVGGAFVDISGNTMNNISKWSITNNLWSPLGSGLDAIGILFTAQCQSIFYNSVDDSLYVGGIFNYAGGIYMKSIAKWDLNTSQWSIVGSGLKDTSYLILVRSICATSNGDISAACAFIDFVNSSPVFVCQVAIFNGSSWAYSCVCDNLIASILPETDNSIYATGVFTKAGNVTATRIAKLNLGSLSFNSLSYAAKTINTSVDRKTRRRNRDLQDD